MQTVHYCQTVRQPWYKQLLIGLFWIGLFLGAMWAVVCANGCANTNLSSYLGTHPTATTRPTTQPTTQPALDHSQGTAFTNGTNLEGTGSAIGTAVGTALGNPILGNLAGGASAFLIGYLYTLIVGTKPPTPGSSTSPNSTLTVIHGASSEVQQVASILAPLLPGNAGKIAGEVGAVASAVSGATPGTQAAPLAVTNNVAGPRPT